MEEKFDLVYQELYTSVYRLAYSYVLNKFDAEDIVQKTFYKLYKNKKILNLELIEIKKWLFRVATNEAKDLLKSYWKKKTESIDEKTCNEQIQNDDLLINILKDIDSSYRIPLFLYYFEGYKINEIAYILKKSVSMIKIRLSKGKEILKKELEEKNE